MKLSSVAPPILYFAINLHVGSNGWQQDIRDHNGIFHRELSLLASSTYIHGRLGSRQNTCTNEVAFSLHSFSDGIRSVLIFPFAISDSFILSQFHAFLPL